MFLLSLTSKGVCRKWSGNTVQPVAVKDAARKPGSGHLPAQNPVAIKIWRSEQSLALKIWSVAWELLVFHPCQKTEEAGCDIREGQE